MVRRAGYVPAHGDFIMLNFTPQAGHEQMGSRPALVLSQSAFNKKTGLAFVCPLSTTQRKNPFYVKVPDALKLSGVIMADQMRSLDYRARGARFIEHCPNSLLREVLARVEAILFA